MREDKTCFTVRLPDLFYLKKNPNIGEIDFPPLTLNVGWNLAIAAKECEKLFDPRSINDCTNTEI